MGVKLSIYVPAQDIGVSSTFDLPFAALFPGRGLD